MNFLHVDLFFLSFVRAFFVVVYKEKRIFVCFIRIQVIVRRCCFRIYYNNKIVHTIFCVAVVVVVVLVAVAVVRLHM